jgi:hypothetical protein
MKKHTGPAKEHVVIVCGGRKFDDSHFIHKKLFKYHAKHPITVLIHGDAQGADKYASAWCKVAPGVSEVAVPALWTKFGSAAGPIRNRLMRRLLKVDRVIAFPGGNGTDDMCRAAREMGIKVRRIRKDLTRIKMSKN